MINNSIIVMMIITIALSLLGLIVPFAAIFIRTKKTEEGMVSSFFLGLLAYFWSQLLIPIPIMYILSMFSFYNDERFSVLHIIIAAVILSALGMISRLWSVWLSNRRTPSINRALCSSIGYAVVGAVGVATTYITYVNYCKFININGIETFKEMLGSSSTVVNDSIVSDMVEKLTNASILEIAFTGINAVMVIFVEMAFMTIIYNYFVAGRKWFGTVVGTGISIAFYSVTQLVSKFVPGTAGSIIYNAILLMCGLASVWYVYGAYVKYYESKGV